MAASLGAQRLCGASSALQSAPCVRQLQFHEHPRHRSTCIQAQPSGSEQAQSIEDVDRYSDKWTGNEPWVTIFDLRERDSAWLDSQQAALVKAFAQKELNMDSEELEELLTQLSTLLPDIGGRVSAMRPKNLAALLRDKDKVAERLVQLRQLLPELDVSALVARQPDLLAQEPETVKHNLETVASTLNVQPEGLQDLLSQQAWFVDPEHVNHVLDELSRLMPGKDARQFLVADPSWLLKVERGTKWLGPHPNEM
ncbi:hypothetical protein WJX73_002170 [Symbiochloris irregularis]|uniref:Uncharacterized protein n=1 Tax=Symbiochloris irregularis TaxID=706552 RepID=A0AAW1PV66_9CHLO